MELDNIDEFALLSGLQHFVFCNRQAALIHIEQLWQDNVLTVQGTILHERVDLPGVTKKNKVEVVRAVPLTSTRLKLVGRADVVEYHFHENTSGQRIPVPVEYKKGVATHRLADQVQLCAQAYCLEERHEQFIPKGYLYYGKSHRRVEVVFTAELRQITEQAARGFHELLRTKMTPKAELGSKCRRCSLILGCLPELSQKYSRDYVQSLYLLSNSS